MKEKREPFLKTPFKEPLKDLLTEKEIEDDIGDIENHGREEVIDKLRQLKILESAKNKIIRVENPHFDDEHKEQEIEFYNKHKNLFATLREYGIHVPEIEVVVGQDAEERKNFMVVDRIYGTSLDKIEDFDPELAVKLDAFYGHLFDYYMAMSKNKLPFFADIADHQIMYGKRAGEDDNNLFIADVETRQFMSPDNPRYYDVLKRILEDISGEISDLKGKGVHLQNAAEKRKEVREFWASQILPVVKQNKDRLFSLNRALVGDRKYLREALEKLKNLYKDELPANMIHGNMPESGFKADKKWFFLLETLLTALPDEYRETPTLKTKITEFERTYKTHEWESRQTTSEDIKKANELITSMLSYLDKKNPDTPPQPSQSRVENKENPVKKVLVVDDDDGVRSGLMDILEISGYEVVGAASGGEALRKLSEIEDIDTVLSDKNMPDMSGVDLLENIHRNMLSRNMLLILQTGMPEPGVQERLSGIGAAYLQKPYEFKDLETVFRSKKGPTG